MIRAHYFNFIFSTRRRKGKKEKTVRRRSYRPYLSFYSGRGEKGEKE